MDHTEEAIAQSLKDLMAEKPYAKISIGEIVARAGFSRKAFYDHFIDKDDLLNHMSYEACLKVREQIFEGDLWDSFLHIAQVMESEPFFKEALTNMGQNGFGQYASDLLYGLFHDTLAAGLRSTIDSEDGVEIFIGGFVETCRMALVLWLNYPEPQPAERFVEFLRKAANAFAMMTCADRSIRDGVQACDYCADHLSEAWSAAADPDTVAAIPPEREGQIRGKVEAALKAYRRDNYFLERSKDPAPRQ